MAVREDRSSGSDTFVSSASNEVEARGKKKHAWTRRARRAAVRFGAQVDRGWSRLRAPQRLAVGYAIYAAVGTLSLCLPWTQRSWNSPLDHLFNVVSALSTTGLTTISVADSYTLAGQLVILALFQLGGVGFMTISSVIIIARSRPLSEARMGVLRTGFALPHYFKIRHFLVQLIVFTLACEALGALILWWRFSIAGVEAPLWSAVFHSVSAFATAGFSLNNTSLEAFADDWIVNLTVGGLCYAGAIGFIVAQDVYYSVKLRERMLTLTSRTILTMTAAVFLIGVPLLAALDPTLRALPLGSRILAAAFQVMSASSTAGFNTVPISALGASSLVVIMILMLIGASPSGTGGGIKTTSVSAILGHLLSILRGRDSVVWLGNVIPPARVAYASAAASLYVVTLVLGVFCLTITERKDFLPLMFEAASAIGTVGLSMGVTGELTPIGKVIVICLMFVGRVGPLTLGLALLAPAPKRSVGPGDDLAV
ncbi:MAG: potassium transporter TrkG [Planctomycetota bacterium]|nr:potassium transporter TrkG [Planctomycetota bacterium]